MCLSGLISLLLALAIYSVRAFPQQQAGDLSPSRTPLPVSTFLARSDLDGDGVTDPVTVDKASFQKAIELQLSRTNAHVVLLFDTAAASDGSLLQ